MSRIVNDDIFTVRRNGNPKYPYNEWSDGQTRVMKRGEDFPSNIRVNSFVDIIRQGMRRRGHEIQVQILNNDTVALKTLPKENNNDDPR